MAERSPYAFEQAKQLMVAIRRAPERRRVDTSHVEARLRAEAAAVAVICRDECDLGHLTEAGFWAGYLTALYQLCGDEAALIALAMIEWKDDGR